MKFKAEMGHWSSIVGNSVLLIGEDGRVLGQIAIMCQDDRLREKDVQTELCEKIYTALNADLCASGQVRAVDLDAILDPIISYHRDRADAGGPGYGIEDRMAAAVESAKAALRAALTPAPQPEVATPTTQEAVAWGESYDGGAFFNTVSLTKTKHHTYPLYAHPPQPPEDAR